MAKLIYLDTNVYNALVDKMTLEQRHRFYKKLNKKRYLLSPINILEILCIKNELRRELIISVLQNICDRIMLAEVEVLLADFIAEKVEKSKLQNFRVDTQFCSSDISHAWQDIYDDKRKTFVFDAHILKQFIVLKRIVALLHAHFTRGGSLSNLDLSGCNLIEAHQEQFIDVINKELSELKALPIETARTVKVVEHIYLLIAIILCVGITPFFEPIDKLWSTLGLTGLKERIGFSFEHFDFLCREGAFVGMGTLMGWQATRPYSNGNLFDCYHVAYLPYVDEFLTLDKGLLDFAQAYSHSRIVRKIRSADSVIQEAMQA